MGYEVFCALCFALDGEAELCGCEKDGDNCVVLAGSSMILILGSGSATLKHPR